MPSYKLVTPPTIEPVTLAELKLHARVDHDTDDALLSALITAARQWAEAYTGRAFMTQTWRLALDLPELAATAQPGALRLPRAPLQSVTTIYAYDDTDSATLWAAANYFVDTQSEPGRVVLRSGACWPLPTRTGNGIVVTYVAGYGGSADAMPAPLRTAILQLAAFWYERRGDALDGDMAVPAAVAALLSPYRLRNAGF